MDVQVVNFEERVAALEAEAQTLVRAMRARLKEVLDEIYASNPDDENLRDLYREQQALLDMEWRVGTAGQGIR